MSVIPYSPPKSQGVLERNLTQNEWSHRAESAHSVAISWVSKEKYVRGRDNVNERQGKSRFFHSLLLLPLSFSLHVFIQAFPPIPDPKSSLLLLCPNPSTKVVHTISYKLSAQKCHKADWFFRKGFYFPHSDWMNYVHTVLCQDDFLEKVPHPSMTISLHLHFNLLPRYFFPSKLRWRKKLVLQIKITLINNDHHHQSYSLSVCLIIRLSGCGWCFVYECSLISYKHNNNYSTHM